ncbi:MAG: 6-phosphofructokinase [Promethearchaeota archaeon]
MRIGVLTGGGDCPGLNSVIYGILLQAYERGHEVVGIKRGWWGFLHNATAELDISKLDDLHMEGGTILYTSRTNPFKDQLGIEDEADRTNALEARAKELDEKFGELDIDGLIAIGGDDTLGVAAKLHQYAGSKVIGVPKTIDNDLSGTDYTFGFWSSVQLATNTMEWLNTTAKSHQRVMVVEVMGRNAGWLTLMSGIASGADVILLPETKFDFKRDIVDVLKQRVEMGHVHHIVAVSEGAVPTDESLARDFKTISKETIDSVPKDVFGNPKLALLNFSKIIRKEVELNEELQEAFEKHDLDLECREFVLGHSMRCGTPNAFDRILGLRLGVRAMEIFDDGKFGNMVALRGLNIETIPIEEGCKQRVVTEELAGDILHLKDLIVKIKYVEPREFNI